MKPDPRIDSYIAARAAFAQPILRHIRTLVHAASPDLDEGIKWSMPAFTFGGKLVVGMAAFKGHVALNFWHGAAVTGGTGVEREAMGSFGRIASLADLPDDAALTAMVRKAVDLARAGAKPAHMTNRKARPDVPVPATLQAALDLDPVATAHWAAFPPSHRREYSEWIAEAKRPETVARRVTEAMGWIASGKHRNWKYDSC